MEFWRENQQSLGTGFLSFLFLFTVSILCSACTNTPLVLSEFNYLDLVSIRPWNTRKARLVSSSPGQNDRPPQLYAWPSTRRHRSPDCDILSQTIRPIPVNVYRGTRRRFRKSVMATTEPVKRLTPQEIVGKLDSQFEKALESGDLSFFPSTVHKHTDTGVDVSFSSFISVSKLDDIPTVAFLVELSTSIRPLSRLA